MNEQQKQTESELRIIEKAVEKELMIQQLKEKHGLSKDEAPSSKLAKVRAKLREIRDESTNNKIQ